jgi:multidrug efflux system outer membrane protein
MWASKPPAMLTCKTILISCAALAVTGCTMIPRYERPAAPVAPQFPGATTATNATPAAEIGWENVFAEERLKQLIALALTNNLDFRVAALNVEQSRAQYRITRSASFPGVNGSGSYTRSHAADKTADLWAASIGTTAYEVDFVGRIRSLNRQALEKFLATAEAKRSAQISLVSEVASQYFTLRQAQTQLELARQTLATVQESYALNKATFDAGASSELDLRTAEAQVQTANINALTCERRIAQAENYLTLLVGEPLPVDLPAPRSFDDTNLVAEVPAGLPSELVQRRPDILKAEHTLLAANANIGAARAAFFPSVKFTASVGTTSSQFDRLFASGTGLWSFSPQVTLPIFTGGQNRADLDSATISTRIEVVNYQKAIQTAFREVADALVATHSYTEQLKAQAKLIEAQQRRFDLATARYRQGDTAYLDVLSAQQDLYSAQQNRLETQLNQLTSRLSLYKSLGGGWK